MKRRPNMLRVPHGLLGQLRVIGMIGIIKHKGRKEAPVASSDRSLNRSQQLTDCKPVIPAGAIGIHCSACCGGDDKFLAFQIVASWPVNPAERKDIIEPFFQEWGRAVPIKWELEHDAVMSNQQLLFSFHIHTPVGVLLIKIADGYIDIAMLLQRLNEYLIGSGLSKVGVCDNHYRFHFDHPFFGLLMLVDLPQYVEVPWI